MAFGWDKIVFALGMAAAIGVASFCGVRFHAAANLHQVIAVFVLMATIAGILCWWSTPPAHSLAHERNSEAPRIPNWIWLPLTGICLLMGWLGPYVPSAPPQEDAPTILLDRPPAPSGLMAGAPAPTHVRLFQSAADFRDVEADESYTAATSTNPKVRGFDYRPTSRLAHTWLNIGGHRWPVPQPPQTTSDELALLKNPTPLADEYPPSMSPDSLPEFGATGVKPSVADFGPPRKLYQWSALPSRQPLSAVPPSGETYPLLLGTDPTARGLFLSQVPVLSVGYGQTGPKYFRVEKDGPDLRGENGLFGGPDILEQLIESRRSYLHATPIAYALPARATPRRMSAVGDLVQDRFPPPRREQRRNSESFPSPWPWLIAAGVFAIGYYRYGS